MPTLESQIALNDSADEANKQYLAQLLAKSQQGIKLRPEELQAVVELRAQENRKINLLDLAARSANGEKLSSDELQQLQELKTGITASPGDVSSVPDIYKEGFEAAVTANTRKLTAQDKAFAKQLGKIGPIANVQLSETQGDTPLVRLANKIYGEEGWRLNDRGQLEVKPKGQTDYLTLPTESLGSTLGRTGITAATTFTGEAIGSIGGIPGVAIGSGIGGGIGENINIKNAIKDAQNMNLFTDEEKQAFNDSIRDATITGASLGALFGGGLPLVKGVSKGLGKGGLKAVPQAIRAEDQSLAQGAINNMRKFATGGKDYDKLRAGINFETLSDKLLTQFSQIPEGTAGRISRGSTDAFINAVNRESDALFNNANQSVLNNISKGKQVGLYDITGLYNDLEEKILKDASATDKPEVLKFLRDLKNELNFTKQQVASGEIASKGAARNQFSSAVIEDQTLDPTLFGPGQKVSFTTKRVTDTFDPSQVTARDFNKTKNFIKDELTKLEDPKYILGKKTKKDITQWLEAFERPFGQGGSEALDVSIKNGFDEKELAKTNPFLKSNFKLKGDTTSFSDVSQGYKIRERGFKKLSVDARKLVQDSISDTDLQSKLLKADPTIARQINGAISSFAGVEDQQLFKSSIKAQVFNPPGAGRKGQILSPVKEGLTPDILEQAQDPEELIKQGIKPSRSLLNAAQETNPSKTKTVLISDRIASDLDSTSSNARIFLGGDADLAKEEAQQLVALKKKAGLQHQAGKTDNQRVGLPSSTINKFTNPEGRQGFVGGILSDINNVVQASSRPLAAPLATTAEALKSATIVPAATVPNIGGYVVRNDVLNTNPETKRRGLLNSLLGGL